MRERRAFCRLVLPTVFVGLLSLSSAVMAQRPLPGRDTTATADSAAQAHALGAVTITTTPAERRAPSASLHIDAPVLSVTPARSAWELMRMTAGVEVHEQGQGPGFASNASIRGFSSDHSTDLALWIDGVPVNEPVNGHAEGYNDWSLLFPRGLQSVDVIKGPTSALFGNFALSGVINVRTLERMTGTEASVEGGSYGQATATLLTGFDHGSAGGGVLGLRAQREDGFRPNARNGLIQGHARLVRDLRPGTTLDGGVELYGANWDSPGYLGEEDFALGNYDVVSNGSDGGFKRRAQERLSLRVLSSSLLWRSTVYATQGRWQLFLTVPPAGGRFEGTGSQTEEEDRRVGLGLTSAATWSGARQDVTLGVEGRWDRSHYQAYFTTDRTRDSTDTQLAARQASGALFVQSTTRVTSRLRLDAGLRADALDTRSEPDGGEAASGTNAILSPKLGAIMRLTSSVSLYGNVSRGFRSTDGVIADPSLPLITAWALETGLKLDARTTRATASLFRMNVSNEQTFNPATLESTSGGASARQGVDLELDWQPVSAAHLTADWTFTDAHYRHFVSGGGGDRVVAVDGGGPARRSAIADVPSRQEEPAPAVLDGLRVFNTAKFVGVAAIEFGPPAASWRLRLSGNWLGPYAPFDEPGVLLGGYGLAHASALLRVGRLEWDVGVRNVFDRRYPELVAAGKVSPGAPRAAYATARVRW
jgi:outer membrane receptor protein involved in Fe transport